MNKKLAALFLVLSLSLSGVLIAPQRAHAIPVTVVADWIEALVLIEDAITAIATPISAVANVADRINTYVLAPIALIKSGQLLKSMTAGVVAFVTGQANGTGIPQFVQNLQSNLQRVGDTQAFAFFVQYSRNSNSPFASSITSALRSNYLQNTSAAGFWSANRSTLSLASPNVNAFLGGNWAQGGAKAWFALTTQPQNNPYTLYQRSQAQLASVVTSATAARLSELNWGQGFLSWCGPAENTTDENDGTGMEGTAPGDACINGDGTWGTIKTPSSVITASLNKVLGSGQDKITQIGNMGGQIQGIFASFVKIMNTINLARDILGGSQSGGLAGAGNLPAFRDTTGEANAAVAGLNATGNTLDNELQTAASASSTARSASYTAAWNGIKNAANAAADTVDDLKAFCTDAAERTKNNNPAFSAIAKAQALAAETALAKITSVISQTTTALSVSAPTAAETDYATRQAASTGEAVANPTGSLNVSGGTLYDQMNLYSENAPPLKDSVCTLGDGGGG